MHAATSSSAIFASTQSQTTNSTSRGMSGFSVLMLLSLEIEFRAKTTLKDIILIEDVFKPDKHYGFPEANSRSFRYILLEMQSWWCYLPSLDSTWLLLF